MELTENERVELDLQVEKLFIFRLVKLGLRN